MRSVRVILTGVLIATATLGATACGDDDDGGGGSGGEGKSYKFAIVRVLDDPFFNSVLLGAQQKAKELKAETGADISVELAGPAAVDPAEQIAIFNSLVTKGVDGIGVAPVDAEAIVPAVKQANNADIPVVAYNLAIADPSVVISSVLTDTLESGRQAGRYMCEQLGEGATGTTFISETDAGNPVLTQRWEGFKDGVGEKCPDITFKEEIIGCEPGPAESVVRSAIVKNRDFVGYYMDTQCTAIPTVSALSKENQLDKPVVAYDATPTELEFLKDEKVDALIAQKGLEQGALTVEYLYKHLNDQKVPTETITGAVLMTRDNLSETEKWAYPAGGGQG
jgi:ribose transport system substrate-binding protein